MCLSATELPASPRFFPPNPFPNPRDMLSRDRFPIEADLEAPLGIQVGAGVALGNPLPPVPVQMGSVGDIWPRGGVGPCPSLSEGGDHTGYWKQDGKTSSGEIKRLHPRSPAERSPPCSW